MIGMSIDWVTIEHYYGAQEIHQDATINLSVAPVVAPLPTAAWIALPTLAILGLIQYTRQKVKTREVTFDPSATLQHRFDDA